MQRFLKKVSPVPIYTRGRGTGVSLFIWNLLRSFHINSDIRGKKNGRNKKGIRRIKK